MTNPLLENHILPPFTRITPRDVLPAMETLIEASEKSLQNQLDSGDLSSWERLVTPIEACEDAISRAWAPVTHLNAVANSDELRAAYEDAERRLTEHHTNLGQNEQLYRAYLDLQGSDGFAALDQAKAQTVKHALRDFKLSGVALTGEYKAEFKRLKAELSTLTTRFANHVLDATNGWYCHVQEETDLAGLPGFLIDAARQAAADRDLAGWVLTLDLPVYMTVMSQSESRAVRKAMYEAYCTRASREGPQAGKWDNTDLIDGILSKRRRLAELLGYANYAEVSLASKMASSTDDVLAFLEDLATKTRPFALKELEELRAFARDNFGEQKLEAWDIPYFSEQLKLKKYSVSQETLRPYFPLDRVINGLFRVANTLYGIEFHEGTAEVWHQDVRYFEIYSDGEKIASCYVDLFSRAKKRSGAWMAECRTRRYDDGKLRLPVAFLVCNFNAPVDDKPCLLTHNEVTTLFHEFGHGLHHMLTKMDVAAVSGISGVEWDAVELPSQFMENFCWQPEVLQFLSGHYQTGEELPPTLLNNMLAAKNFQSALQMLRQLEFAMFDLRLHMEYGSPDFVGVQQLLDAVREKIAVIIPPAFNKFQNGFTHIFAGGYAAGYYSYKWAEVLSADAFAAFEEEGIFNKDTGRRFLREVLEKGGSEDAMILFKKFRGREPDTEALMRHSGLTRDN